jgi:hypothetical protein
MAPPQGKVKSGGWRQGAKFGSLLRFIQQESRRMRAPHTTIGVHPPKPRFHRAPSGAASTTQ